MSGGTLAHSLARPHEAAAYVAGGQDWERLFRFYDKDASGELNRAELTHAIRADLQLPPKELSREEIELVFGILDKDGGVSVALDELLHFIDPDVHALGGGDGDADQMALTFGGAVSVAVGMADWRDEIANFRVDQTIGQMGWKRKPKKQMGVITASKDFQPGGTGGTQPNTMKALGASHSMPALRSSVSTPPPVKMGVSVFR